MFLIKPKYEILTHKWLNIIIRDQVADKPEPSSLSIIIGTTWLVGSYQKSVSLALKVTVNPCKSNYFQCFVYRRNIYLSFEAAGNYCNQPLSTV